MAVIPPLTSYVNLGPLPTAVSFPASCTNTLYDMQHTYLGLNQFQPTAGCALKECCPSGKFYTENWAWYTSYFSPGVCPQAYTSCPGPISPIVLSTAPGDTVAFCCPSGYGCPMQSPFYGACGSGLSEATTTLVVLDDISRQSRVSSRLYYSTDVYFQGWAVAYPIQVRMGGTPTTSASNTLGTSSTASAILPGASTSVPSGPSGKLSTGAIVGIAFGGFFSIALVALGFLWLLRRRGNMPAQPALAPATSQAEGMGKSVFAGQAPTPGYYPEQIYQEMPHEPRQISELPAKNNV